MENICALERGYVNSKKPFGSDWRTRGLMENRQHISVNPVARRAPSLTEYILRNSMKPPFTQLDEAAFAELRSAFLEYQVLFFRDQEITRDEQKAFARRLGTLQIHPFTQRLRKEGHPDSLFSTATRSIHMSRICGIAT
jgi:alpha-ketoglutarate-dependent taurine dioxygenase